MRRLASFRPYYNRDGTPFEGTVEEQLALWRVSRRVARTKVTDGADLSCEVDVSTVFLVINHQYDDGPPLIFETMTFASGDAFESDCERYSSEEEAVLGHVRMVAKVAAGMTDPIVVHVE